MFYYLDGILALCEAGFAVIDCGGVGYGVTVSLTTSEAVGNRIGSKTRLYTYLQVKEDGVELFGFATKEELSAFKLLVSVSGVGPKAAVSLLSTLPADKLTYAICTEDVKALSKAPGVGGKTAARIVLELKDKVSKSQLSGDYSSLSSSSPAPVSSALSGKLGEAADALSVLGYSRGEVAEALRGMDISGLSLEEIITRALKVFGSR
ncbi:MAG: Holliday junction branch migration protein RuvA [Clostridia bacterium]|nr:Holliday junction branch migration protein RuvA [Clostridia bacterium]